MTKDEALKLALELLELHLAHHEHGCVYLDPAVTAIKEALAQPEQEPVGKFAKFTDGIWREVTDGSAGVPLYTTPPAAQRKPLTDMEISLIDWESLVTKKDCVRVIEAAHGIKENT